MGRSEPRVVMTAKDMDRCLEQIASKILKQVSAVDDVIFVGIRSRGVPLAERLAQLCGKKRGAALPVGLLDINLYRDDLSEVDHHPVVKRTELPGSISGKGIILVDDVLYTGRTIRAALDALVDFGRPRFVQLAVLIDRGWRELPIQPEYVGKVIETTAGENVHVQLQETDGENQVVVYQQQ